MQTRSITLSRRACLKYIMNNSQTQKLSLKKCPSYIVMKTLNLFFSVFMITPIMAA